MNAAHSTADPKVIKAALALLRSGIATQAEVAELAGTSRQLVRHWAMRADIDAAKARAARLQRHWQAQLRR